MLNFADIDTKSATTILSKAWEGKLMKVYNWSYLHQGGSNVGCFDGHVEHYGVEGAYNGFQFFYGLSSFDEYVNR